MIVTSLDSKFNIAIEESCPESLTNAIRRLSGDHLGLPSIFLPFVTRRAILVLASKIQIQPLEAKAI